MISTILIGIAALFVFILAVALFVSKKYRIQRDVVVLQNKTEVFDYIRFLKNQDFYSKWVMSDPDKRTDFRGTDGTPGFVYAWDSDNKRAGKGEQEIISIDPENRVDIEIRFEKPFKGTAQTLMTTEDLPEGRTRVTWSMEGQQKYPMNLMNLFTDKMLGTDMEISLNKLKQNLESR